jgi:hypothetical protein
MSIKPRGFKRTVQVVSPDGVDYYLNFVEYIMLRADIKRTSETGWKVAAIYTGNGYFDKVPVCRYVEDLQCQTDQSVIDRTRTEDHTDRLVDINEDGMHEYSEKLFTEYDDALMYLAFGEAP